MFDFQTLEDLFGGRQVGKSVSVAKNMSQIQALILVNFIYHPVTAPSFSSFILDQDFMAQDNILGIKPYHMSKWMAQMFESINVPLLLGTGWEGWSPLVVIAVQTRRRNCVQMRKNLNVCVNLDFNSFCHIPSLFTWVFPQSALPTLRPFLHASLQHSLFSKCGMSFSHFQSVVMFAI